MYCPKCKSKLFPIDAEYIRKFGICSYCITYKGEVNGTDTNKDQSKDRILGIKRAQADAFREQQDLQGDSRET